MITVEPKAQTAPALTDEAAAARLGVTLPELRALVRDGLIVRGAKVYGGGITETAIAAYERWKAEQ